MAIDGGEGNRGRPLVVLLVDVLVYLVHEFGTGLLILRCDRKLAFLLILTLLWCSIQCE